MKIISWDIGIHNLAYCIMDNTKILEWNKIDILDDIKDKQYFCTHILKNNNVCNKKALYHIDFNNDLKYFCKVHSKKNIGCKAISKEQYCQDLNKNNKECNSKALYYYIDINNNIKYCCNKHCKKIQPDKLIKYITKNNASFFYKSISLFNKLDQIKDKILDVDEVLIENQPVHKNPIMKSIQMMLYSFYMIYGKILGSKINEIYLINATQKLKIYDGPEIKTDIKDKHSRNKFLGIEYCKYFLKDCPESQNIFNSFKKKDDIADTYLQGIYFLKNKKII